jgi:hypothetical protein
MEEGYPPTSIPILPPPRGYYGARYVEGKENAIADQQRNYTAPDDTCPYPDPPYTSYCKGYHEAYDFNWNDIIPGSSPPPLPHHHRHH